MNWKEWLETAAEDGGDETVYYFEQAWKESGRNEEVLDFWTRRFPRQREILIMAAAGDDCSDHPELAYPFEAPTDYAKIAAEAVSKYRTANPAPAQNSLTSIVVRLKTIGVSAQSAVSELRVSTNLLARIDQHLVDAASVPTVFVQDLSKCLQCRIQDVWDYLDAPPKLAANAFYSSAAAPMLGANSKVSFSDAINMDNSISAADKDFWLSQSTKATE